MPDHSARTKSHFTTRRGFITATGFGVVSLYGLWAAYGAAPFGLFGHGDDHGGTPHGGHAHGAPSGPDAEEFRKLVEGFVEAHRRPDGSVAPRRAAAAHPVDHVHHDAGTHSTVSSPEAAPPVDAYLLAYQWGFTPDVLRLSLNERYRFRMMAVDVTHGAGIRLGAASRVIRLRTGVLVEQELRFTRPGEYLVYCTSYCGILHDRMHGRIIVA